MRYLSACAIIQLSFTSEIAAAVFPSGFCDRGALPSNDAPFNVEMPAAGSDIPCPAAEEMWRTSTAFAPAFWRERFFWKLTKQKKP